MSATVAKALDAAKHDQLVHAITNQRQTTKLAGQPAQHRSGKEH
jgi:hypothetical protein